MSRIIFPSVDTITSHKKKIYITTEENTFPYQTLISNAMFHVFEKKMSTVYTVQYHHNIY